MKYIIDIPSSQEYSYDKDFKSLDLKFHDDNFSGMTRFDAEPYTEHDLSPLVDEAVEAIENEVWEFIRICLVMDGSDFVEAFDSCSYINLLEYSYQEAKAKYEAWLKQKDEIHVGDEIVGIYSDGEKSPPLVVLKVEGNYYYGIYSKTGEFVQGGLNYEKTGRHFSEVIQLMEKMRGEQKWQNT